MKSPITENRHHHVKLDTVVTRRTVPVKLQRIWDTLMFYEQIPDRPPWLLRRLLPVPIGTEGYKSKVGDEALCRYEGGHIVKRVTHIERGRRYAFEVIEQALDVGGGMRLEGGEYTMRDVDGGSTEVALVTRYISPRGPRWLWRPIEAVVCHMFHRHILRSMAAAAAMQPSAGAVGEQDAL